MCLRYPKPAPRLLSKQARRAERDANLRQMRADARARAGGRCEVCGKVGAETHHIIARSRGGSDTVGNAAFLCHADHALVTGHVIRIYGRDSNGQLLHERVTGRP